MWQAVDKCISTAWYGLLGAAHTLRLEWQHASARAAQRRADMEASRGTLRTLLRAWREVADDVRAGAAKWDQRWRTGHGLELARRLTFADASSMWATEAGWRARMVLAWMRLVRAGKVDRQRKGSCQWRRGEADRMARVAAMNAFVHPVKRVRAAAQATAVSERVALEEGVIAELGCTSGAASVIARRRQRSESDLGGNGDGRSAKRPCVGSARGDGHLHECDDASSAATGRTRAPRTDAQIMFTQHARECFESLVGLWQWRPRFGDG